MPYNTAHRQISLWLFAVAALVFIMVFVGGLTRMTESGLSITEWKPVTGSLPPMSEAHWQAEFDKYRQIPQYKLVNKGMSLDEFKYIYWWEWGHRFMGRLIGFAFLIPFVWFAATKKIDRALMPRLILMFVLGGMQGAVGWWMVASGLTHRTDVSQYRLVAHLSLALVIYCYMLWVALSLWRGRFSTPLSWTPAAKWAAGLLALIFIQIMLGGFVAGLKAGYIHNTWPDMSGALVPADLFFHSPWWINFFENVTMVQFQHRMVAYVLAALVIWHWFSLRRTEPSSSWLLWSVLVQIAIGIWTLLAVVPIELGAAHQLGAMVVLTIAVIHLSRGAKV